MHSRYFQVSRARFKRCFILLNKMLLLRNIYYSTSNCLSVSCGNCAIAQEKIHSHLLPWDANYLYTEYHLCQFRVLNVKLLRNEHTELQNVCNLLRSNYCYSDRFRSFLSWINITINYQHHISRRTTTAGHKVSS